MFNWLKRLFGGSDSSATSEPAEPAPAPTPPEPTVTPSEPPADAGTAAQEPPGDEPA